MHDFNKSGYIELTRIIMAKYMEIPPDNIDMTAIFRCVQRAIEDKIDNNLKETVLVPENDREIQAVVSEIGETIIPMMFNNEYPFDDFVKNYSNWYDENKVAQFLKIKFQSILEDEEK